MQRSFIVAISFVLFIINGFAQESPDITVDELKGHVYFLADDELEGRKPGTGGDIKAAEYIREHLLQSGVELLGDNGFQKFFVTTSVKLGENNKLNFEGNEGKVEEDFVPVNFSANASLKSSVVFVGYGIKYEGENLKWDDYAGVDVNGKWVIILRGTPDSLSTGSIPDDFGSLTKKVITAKDNGAAGIIFVSGKEFDADDNLMDITRDMKITTFDIPVLQVKRDFLDKVLANYEVAIELLENQIQQSESPYSINLETEISAETEIVKVEKETTNIIGMVKGSDPALSDQYIVIGAHYDHLGYGGPGSGSRSPNEHSIHNGADDNASGSSAILEIIEKAAANKDKLKRSIIFAAFGAEEMGLIGSKEFVEKPPVELDKIDAMFNFDMVGRLDSNNTGLAVGGTGTAVEFDSLLDENLENYPLEIKRTPEGYGPSDHASFYAQDIPVLFFFTGAHEDYHKPSDDSDKLNYAGEKLITDFAYDILIEVANAEKRLTYQEAGPKTQESSRPNFKVTLGIMPDVSSSDIQGLKAEAVIEGRPAYKAGMQKGDIIVAMEGKPVNDIYEYMARLADFKPGQRITVEVMRDGKKEILIVEL